VRVVDMANLLEELSKLSMFRRN